MCGTEVCVVVCAQIESCCVFVITIHSVAKECIVSLQDGLSNEGVPLLLSGDCGVVVFAFCWL